MTVTYYLQYMECLLGDHHYNVLSRQLIAYSNKS